MGEEMWNETSNWMEKGCVARKQKWRRVIVGEFKNIFDNRYRRPHRGAAVRSRQIYRAPENITSRTSCVRNHHTPRGYRDPLSISAEF